MSKRKTKATQSRSGGNFWNLPLEVTGFCLSISKVVGCYIDQGYLFYLFYVLSTTRPVLKAGSSYLAHRKIILKPNILFVYFFVKFLKTTCEKIGINLRVCTHSACFVSGY